MAEKDEQDRFVEVLESLDSQELIGVVTEYVGLKPGQIDIDTIDTNRLAFAVERLEHIKRGGIIQKGGRTVFMKVGIWHQVQKELHILICTKDKKYADIRRKFTKEGKEARTVILASISSAIGASLGYMGAVLVPLVALALIVMLKVGKEVWCAEDEPK